MTEPGDPVELAVRALRHRDRSAGDVAARLARAGVPEAALAEVLETLVHLGYVDDARFARTRAATLASRGYGDAAIREELERHEIAAGAVEDALAELVSEFDRARELVARDGGSPRTARRLAAKGFSDEAIEDAIGTVARGGGEAV